MTADSDPPRATRTTSSTRSSRRPSRPRIRRAPGRGRDEDDGRTRARTTTAARDGARGRRARERGRSTGPVFDSSLRKSAVRSPSLITPAATAAASCGSAIARAIRRSRAIGTPRSAATCASDRRCETRLELVGGQAERAGDARVEGAAHAPHPDCSRGAGGGHTGTLAAGMSERCKANLRMRREVGSGACGE